MTVSTGEHFPIKLYRMLEDASTLKLTDIISWAEDGRSFLVHEPKVFENTMMRKYFNHTKYKSFQRQLNLYQFIRSPRKRILGVYSHPLFCRGKEEWCRDIRRPPVSKQSHGYSKTDMVKLGGPFLQEALLDDLLPLDNFSSSCNTNLVRSAKKRLDIPRIFSCPNLQTSMAHSITNGWSTAIATSTARSPMLHVVEALHLDSPSSSPFFFDDTKVPGVPLKDIEYDCQFSDSFAANTNPFLSRSFRSVRDNINWQSSSFLPIADDDEISIGTIDSISNITQTCTSFDPPAHFEVRHQIAGKF